MPLTNGYGQTINYDAWKLRSPWEHDEEPDEDDAPDDIDDDEGSACCGAAYYADTDICSDCKEHG